ncbi:RuvC-like Holliday junction resolvase [Vibrio phage VAP7]|uniref:Ribonuclease H-like domain protein n=2 Tax=Vapseptimavirus VAP7 TaxID=2841303 RepID=A0A4Y5TV00_9CAUD|nr:RuvC-like Holliday junction resolvase [Vibrio phage VAP7]AWY10188.1 ribonuclease H-like domain protein [Vibrio phage VP-1]QDB73194.1 ribonuclease H-like domain protein [Vibrio phage VAP7]UFD98121.1 hypothetical protein [Vibrio phage BX-1]
MSNAQSEIQPILGDGDIYAGIDYSMNGPAICIWDSSLPLTHENLRYYNYGKTKSKCGEFNNVVILAQEKFDSDEPRFREIALWARAVLQSNKVTKASLEGYAMGGKSNRVFQIGECTGQLKQELYNLNIDYEIIPPTQVKMQFQGKGNAKKEQMIDCFNELWGIKLHQQLLLNKEYEKPVDDLVDSFANLICHPDLSEIRLQLMGK